MNKLELIDTLRFEAQIKKSEAAAVVNLFFNKMVDALANGDRIEIRRLCSFYVKEYKNIKHTLDAILEPVKASRSNLRNYRFSSPGRN